MLNPSPATTSSENISQTATQNPTPTQLMTIQSIIPTTTQITTIPQNALPTTRSSPLPLALPIVVLVIMAVFKFALEEK
jgi:hypothetical protein